MTHDFAAQRAETNVAFADLEDKDSLPDIADIDYFLVPNGEEANWKPLAEDLTRQGYDCQWIDDEGAPYLMATLPDQALSATGIWLGEEVATRTALSYGFLPDGWGFSA